MNLILKESNSPFWILGVGKNKVFEAPFHSKSKTKQKEAAEELMKDNEKIEEVYVVSGNIWDNMPGNTKDSIGYIKNKGTKLLSRSDLKESDYPKGVSRDPLPKKGAKVITNAGMALEKSIKPKLKDDKIKTDETLTEAIPVDKIVTAVLFTVDNWDVLKDIIETLKDLGSDVYDKCMTIFNYIKDKNGDVKEAAQEIGNILIKNESTILENILTEAKRPKSWGSQFAVNVLNAYDKGDLTMDNIEQWDTEYNGGKKPNPPFDTKQILDYYANGNDCRTKSKLESKIVQPVGNPQTANSFVNIDIDLDHMEVSDFIVRLSQAIRSEQTAILEYAALRSANGITSDDKQTIDAIIEEEKNHMVAITTILYKQLLMNHKENVKGANDEFVLPKFGAEEVFDNFEEGKLTESISILIDKIITENVDKSNIITEQIDVSDQSSTISQDQ